MSIGQKELILESLHLLLSHNVIGDKQYRNRYNGFTAELDFMRWYREHRPTDKLVAGGMFVPTVPGSDPFNSSVYLTVSTDSPERYIELYRLGSPLASSGLFFISYNEAIPVDQWSMQSVFLSRKLSGIREEIVLPVPNYSAYKFTLEPGLFHKTSLDELQDSFALIKTELPEKKIPEDLKRHFIEKFTQFELADLIELYVNRLFFDGYISLLRERGSPLDVDAFASARGGSGMTLLEIKEKDVSKREPRGFGMDVRRIDSLTLMERTFKSPAVYVVRHINNQKERVFKEWVYIRMAEFRKKVEGNAVIQGGHGMRATNSVNPTLVCDYRYFKSF